MHWVKTYMHTDLVASLLIATHLHVITYSTYTIHSGISRAVPGVPGN